MGTIAFPSGMASAQVTQPESMVCPVVSGYEVIFNLEEQVQFDTTSGAYRVNCWYNPVPQADGTLVESELILDTYWAPPDGDPKVLDWTPQGVGGVTITYCSDVDEFTAGLGVTASTDLAIRSTYKFRQADKPYDPELGKVAAEELRTAVIGYARLCDGVEIIPRASYYTPLPQYLADARASSPDLQGEPAAPPPTVAATPTTVATTTSVDGGVAPVPVGADPPPPAEEAGPTWLKVIGWVLLAVSVAGLLWTIKSSGKERRIRPRFDVIRIILVGGMAIGMFIILGNTPWWAALVGIGVGLVLGLIQGRNVAIRVDGKKAFEKRAAWAIGAFIVGLLIAQIAGLLNRSGVIKLGVGLSFMSAAAAIGLFVGRRKQLSSVRSNALASATLVTLTVVGLLPFVAVAIAQEVDNTAANTAILADLDAAVAWDSIELNGGLFSDQRKPPIEVSIAPGLTEVPEPVSRSDTWSFVPPIWDNDAGFWVDGDPANEQSYSVTETFSFSLTADGLCCTVAYDGAGTAATLGGGPRESTAAGTMGDFTSVAARTYLNFNEEGSQLWGLPFDEPTIVPIPGEDPSCRRPVTTEGRATYDDWVTTFDGNDGGGSPPPRFDLATDCDIEGFDVATAMDNLPPVPAATAPERNVAFGELDAGGCPVYSESFGALYDPSMGETTTTDLRRLMLNPNSTACTAWITVGQEGPGGVRSEMQYDLATAEPKVEARRQFDAAEDLFDAVPAHQIPPDNRCAFDENGIAVAPSEDGATCVARTFHEVGGGVITIWTDYESTDGPNVLVRGIFPWGHYNYRCHHCDASSPEIARIVTAMEVFGSTGLGNFGPDAEVVGSVGAPEGTTGETTDVDTTIDQDTIDVLTDDPYEAAVLAGLIALAGTAGLVGVSIAEAGAEARDGARDEPDPEPIDPDADNDVRVWDEENRVGIWMTQAEADAWYAQQRQREIDASIAAGEEDLATWLENWRAQSEIEMAEAAERMQERAADEQRWADWEERMRRRDALDRRQDLLEADSTRRNSSSDWWWSVLDEYGREAQEDMLDLPGELVRGVARGVGWTAEQLSDPENWTIAWETTRDSARDAILVALGDPDKTQEVADNLRSGIETAGTIAGTLYAAAENDPVGAAAAVGRTVLGVDNWEQALDKDTPVGERFGRAVWGVIETGGALWGAATTAVNVADRVSDLARTVDALADASRVVDKVDDVIDATRLGDAAVDARRVADADALAEVRAAAAARREAQAGVGSFDDLLVDGKLPPDAWVRNLPEGAVIEANWLHEVGYSQEQINALAKVADDLGITIGSRTTNMESMRWIRDGKALAKPVNLKSKTISNLDTYLGAAKADEGLVGYFRPREPVWANVPDDLHDAVRARYHARLTEYNELRGDVTKLVSGGGYVEEGGKIFKVLPDGRRLPFAGDIDLVYLRKADGSALSASEYRNAVDALKQSGAKVQHGAETDVINYFTKDLTARNKGMGQGVRQGRCTCTPSSRNRTQRARRSSCGWVQTVCSVVVNDFRRSRR